MLLKNDILRNIYVKNILKKILLMDIKKELEVLEFKEHFTKVFEKLKMEEKEKE